MEFFSYVFNTDFLMALVPSFLIGFVKQEPLLVAYVVGVFFVATFVLWWLFAHLMMLRDFIEKKAKGQWYYYPIRVIGYALFVVGYVYDVAYNWLIATVLFLELPQEATLTARLTRYIHGIEPGLWRRSLAIFTCVKLIEPWDQGHCDLYKLRLAHRVV